jgi:hypothetical protein
VLAALHDVVNLCYCANCNRYSPDRRCFDFSDDGLTRRSSASCYPFPLPTPSLRRAMLSAGVVVVNVYKIVPVGR